MGQHAAEAADSSNQGTDHTPTYGPSEDQIQAKCIPNIGDSISLYTYIMVCEDGLVLIQRSVSPGFSLTFARQKVHEHAKY